MQRFRLALSTLALLLAALVVLSCSAVRNRQLQSISLIPASADAENFAEGHVQFTASGYYDDSVTVTPLPATWGTCYQEASTNEITVSQEGVAQCASGAVGTFTVWANDPPNVNGANCLAITACGGGCFIAGTAQLTCP